MKQFLDIRMTEKWAKQYLGTGIGEGLPVAPGLPAFVRRIEVDTSDPFVQRIKEIALRYESQHGARSACHMVMFRDYQPDELQSAELLQLCIKGFVDTYGEEWGTEYEESNACPRCGFGRLQVSPLILDTRKLPKRFDFLVTISSDEWIVSERLAGLIKENAITGCHLVPIQNASPVSDRPKWHQLIVNESAGEAVPPSRFGLDYFHDDLKGEYVCPEHLLSGLNILTELYIGRETKPTTDIAKSRNRIGRKAGWLVPNPLLLISPRFAEILRQNNIKGYTLEVVHLV